VRPGDPEPGISFATEAPRWGAGLEELIREWREIPRRAWGDSISVLASCETDADELNARARGYAVARVIEQLPADGRATEAGIPCPAQMRAGVQCATCRLCWSDPQRTILFGAHGVSSERVRRKLRVLGG
jgi:hypothetical protein